MDRLITLLGQCNKYLCASFLGAMVLMVFVNTVLRYVFNSGIIMAEELVRYLFIWATYLAVISVYYDHNHIAVTTITDRLPPKALAVFSFVMNFVALYGLAMLTQSSMVYFGETTNMGQVTGIPYKFAAAAVVVGAGSCLCIVLIDIVKQVRGFVRGAK